MIGNDRVHDRQKRHERALRGGYVASPRFLRNVSVTDTGELPGSFHAVKTENFWAVTDVTDNSDISHACARMHVH